MSRFLIFYVVMSWIIQRVAELPVWFLRDQNVELGDLTVVMDSQGNNTPATLELIYIEFFVEGVS